MGKRTDRPKKRPEINHETHLPGLSAPAIARGGARAERPRPRGMALRLGLADVSTEEAYTRVLRAVDEGSVTISEGVRLTEIVGRALPLRDAAEFRRRLAGAEAAHRAALEATRQLGARVPPASARTVEAAPFAPTATDSEGAV